MNSILILVDTVINLYIWALIISAILSWLIAFDIINTSNRLIATVAEVLYRITEPALRPIRRIVPTMGGVDLSPIILILLLFLARNLMFEYFGSGVRF